MIYRLHDEFEWIRMRTYSSLKQINPIIMANLEKTASEISSCGNIEKPQHNI